MTTEEPRTYTLTERQRMLISEGLAMVAAQRRARRSEWRPPGWGKPSGEGVRRASRVQMDADQYAEIDVLRKMFRTDPRP